MNDNEIRTRYKRNLKSLLEHYEINRAEFRGAIGVSEATLKNYLNVTHSSMPSILTHLRIEHYLGTTLNSLSQDLGPRYVDQDTKLQLLRLASLYCDTSKPEYSTLFQIIAELELDQVELFRRIAESLTSSGPIANPSS